jgi:hypothetical protein
MVASLDPRSAPSIPTSNVAVNLNPPVSGLSQTPSSIESCQVPQRSGMGFCCWIKCKLEEIWLSIKACFGYGTTTVDNSSASTMQRRVQQGEAFINDHFSRDFFSQVNPLRTAVVVVLKYNNESSVPCSRLTEGREDITEGAKTELRELLGSDANRDCNDGILEIETLVFEKNANNTFNFHREDSWSRFSNHSRGNSSGDARNLVTAHVYNQLTRAIPSPVDRQQVIDFVINRL